MRYCLAILCVVAVVAPAPVQADVNSLSDLWKALGQCWNPPPSLDPLSATVRFSLNRNGDIIGQPAITYSQLGDDEGIRRAFVRSVLLALAQCTPLPLSPAFAEAFAGRPVTVRFAWERRRKSMAPAVGLGGREVSPVE